MQSNGFLNTVQKTKLQELMKEVQDLELKKEIQEDEEIILESEINKKIASIRCVNKTVHIQH